MNNPFFNQFSGTPGPDFFQIVNQFKEFSAQMTPDKARTAIMQMLQSGQMSQQQFEQLKQSAASFMNLLK